MYVRPQIRGWHCSQDTGRLTTALRTRRQGRQNNDASKKSPEITQQYHRPRQIFYNNDKKSQNHKESLFSN